MRELARVTAFSAAFTLLKFVAQATYENELMPTETASYDRATSQVTLTQSQHGTRAAETVPAARTAVTQMNPLSHETGPITLPENEARAQVLRALRVRAMSYRQCYSSRKAFDPSLSGSVVVKVRVVSGRAVMVDASEGTMPDGRVNACVAAAVSRAPFPRLNNSAEVTYPVSFSAE
jgi:hypothetical protein